MRRLRPARIDEAPRSLFFFRRATFMRAPDYSANAPLRQSRAVSDPSAIQNILLQYARRLSATLRASRVACRPACACVVPIALRERGRPGA
ncbi:hypothetical protein OH687_05405 [Burkholderia anthina]|nr:hypothetical protein OH687_05405 [Burkholderia anthina]